MIITDACDLPRLFDPDAEDELALADFRGPGLADDDPVDRRGDGPCRFVDPTEVVQPSDDVAATDPEAAREHFFIVAFERSGNITVEVDD